MPDGWGAPAQSYDGIPYANYELQLLGLRSQVENAAEPEAVYCEGANDFTVLTMTNTVLTMTNTVLTMTNTRRPVRLL